MTSMKDLPIELLAHTLSFLTPKEVLLAAPVCKVWYKATQNQLLWKEFCRQCGWVKDSELSSPEDWKDLYKCSAESLLIFVLFRIIYLDNLDSDLSWMERSDAFGGFREPKYYPRVRYAVAKENVWFPERKYTCPAGFHWATEKEYYDYTNGTFLF